MLWVSPLLLTSSPAEGTGATSSGSSRATADLSNDRLTRASRRAPSSTPAPAGLLRSGRRRGSRGTAATRSTSSQHPLAAGPGHPYDNLLPGALEAGRGRRGRPRPASPRFARRSSAPVFTGSPPILAGLLGAGRPRQATLHGLRARDPLPATAGAGGLHDVGSDSAATLSLARSPPGRSSSAGCSRRPCLADLRGRRPSAPQASLLAVRRAHDLRLLPRVRCRSTTRSSRTSTGLALRGAAHRHPLSLRPLAFGYPGDAGRLEARAGAPRRRRPPRGAGRPDGQHGRLPGLPVRAAAGPTSSTAASGPAAAPSCAGRRSPNSRSTSAAGARSGSTFEPRTCGGGRGRWTSSSGRAGRAGSTHPGGRRPRAPSPPPRRGTRSACSSPAAPGRRRCSCSGEGGRRRSRSTDATFPRAATCGRRRPAGGFGPARCPASSSRCRRAAG